MTSDLNDRANTRRREEILSRGIFQGVAVESVWGLLEHTPVRSLQQGNPLLSKDEPNDTMHMVLSGCVCTMG